MQFGSDLISCPNKADRVRVIIRVRLENMGPGIPDNDKHPVTQRLRFRWRKVWVENKVEKGIFLTKLKVVLSVQAFNALGQGMLKLMQ